MRGWTGSRYKEEGERERDSSWQDDQEGALLLRAHTVRRNTETARSEGEELIQIDARRTLGFFSSSRVSFFFFFFMKKSDIKIASRGLFSYNRNIALD